MGLVERTVKWVRRRPFQAVAAFAGLLALAAGMVALVAQANYQEAKAQNLQNELASRDLIKQQRDEAQALTAQRKWVAARGALQAAIDTIQLQPAESQGQELLAELRDNLQRVEQQIKDEQNRELARQRRALSAKPYGEAVKKLIPWEGVNLARQQEQARGYIREALAPYAPDEARGPAPRVLDGLERDRPFLDADEFKQLVGNCYELLLIWANVEANALPAGPGELEEQSRERGRRALALLDEAARLGQAYQFDTRIFHFRAARYQAQSQGKRFDAAVVPEGTPREPTGPLDWFLQGLEEFQAGRFKEAGEDCTQVLLKQSNHLWARCVRGLCYLHDKHWDLARVDLTACLEQQSDLTPALLGRGIAIAEMGARSWDQAVRLHKKAKSEVGLTDQETEELKRSERHAGTDFASARSDFDKALAQRLEPLALYTAVVNRGVLSYRQGRWAEASADLERAIQLNPTAFQAYVNLTQALFAAGRVEEAPAMLSKALDRLQDKPELKPLRADLYRLRADLYLDERLGNRQAAQADLEQAVALEPGNSKSRKLADNLVKLGQLLAREGQHQEALARFNRALRVRPELLLVERFRAESLLALHQDEKAAEALDHYLHNTDKPEPRVLQARGVLYAEMNKLPEAVETYSAYLRITEAHPDPDTKVQRTRTRGYRGWAYLQIGATRLALEDFEVCLREQPSSADYLTGRASARMRLRERHKALEDAEAAEQKLQAGPGGSARLLYYLGCVYSQAAALLDLEARSGRPAKPEEDPTLYERRAVQLLNRALEEMPPEKRAKFWSGQVETDPALTAVRNHPLYRQLANRYGQKVQ
jgi:tetratricopeptide (TPR) repeat protein